MDDDNGKSCSEANAEQSATSNVSHDCSDGAVWSVNRVRKEKGIVAEMVTHRYAEEYKMCHKHRGLALIFSHELFNKRGLASRPETSVDTKNLERVLKHLDFNVEVHKDLHHKQVMKKIASAVALNHREHDCILVALLTHGDNGVLYAKDKLYKLDDIWEAFSADKCPSLAGKPKIFIIQACRGKRRDPGHIRQSMGHTETDSDSGSNYKIPKYADFLIAFCTVPQYCSWSNSVQGSWFIHSLCDELEANARRLDMLNLLTFVAQRVANCESSDEQHKQITCTMSTLTRILRFGDSLRDRF
ncbi:caspase-like [Drosophila novamexicana]|uniref:caspase-like n=1 Tax=Drosophila novamexicana TaxID=47314 RepID=UPI0011E5ACEB|nr:caspase-like [Drosophila novamexicana]